MARIKYFTICSKNYLAYALTLGRSLQIASPGSSFTIFLADTANDSLGRVEFDVVLAADIGIPTFDDMIARYSILEFNTAIKAACFKYLFANHACEGAVYLDPDIYVLRALEHVEAELEGGSHVVLTPHSLAPLDDGGDPDDLRLLRTGVYNLGFVGFRNSRQSAAFLDWWHDRLALDCRVDLNAGLFVDQKWMDLAPAYVDDAKILRHPGYNAAYWNLHSRPVSRGPDGWQAAGQLLHFFHFSGVVPGDGRVFSKHQNRFDTGNIGDLVELLHEYLHALDANGHSEWSGEVYGYAIAADLSGVDQFIRNVFRRFHPVPVHEQPISATQLEVLCNAKSEQIPSFGLGITNLGYEIWASRPDLRLAFDLTQKGGQEGFLGWLLSSGVRECKIPARLLPGLASRAQSQASLRVRLIHNLLLKRHVFRSITDRLPGAWVRGLKRLVQRLGSSAEPARPDGAPEADRAERGAPVAMYGYFGAETGLGEAARRHFRALRSAGIPAVARRIKADSSFRDSEQMVDPIDHRRQFAPVHIIHVNADQVCVADSWGEPDVFTDAHYRIGLWAWELERFPDAWKPAFHRVDEIWVPSQFVADAVSKQTDLPVYVFPHPLPDSEPNVGDRVESRLRFALPADGVIFLTAFDFNSYVMRKNPLGVLDAFRAAKKESPDIALVVKCHGGVRHDAVRESIMKQARSMEDVFIIDRVLDSAELEALYSACDCLVSLHRSEGFGLMLAEAMHRGMPVIATDYSGSCEFFDAEVGEAIPYTLVPVGEGEYVEAEGAVWAEPDTEAAARAIVRLASSPARRKALGDAGRNRVMQRLSPDRIGRDMAARLDEVLSQVGELD